MCTLLLLALLLALLFEPAMATNPAMDNTLAVTAIETYYADPDQLLVGACHMCGYFANDCFCLTNPPPLPRVATFTPETFHNHPEWPAEAYRSPALDTFDDLDLDLDDLDAPQTPAPILDTAVDNEEQPLHDFVKEELDWHGTTVLPSTVLAHVEDTYLPGDKEVIREARREILQRRHAPRKGGFPCTHDGCGKVHNRYCDLKRHRKIHLKASERPHKCDLCDQAFLYPKDKDRHQQTHDQSSAPKTTLYCSADGCDSRFSRRDNLLRHLRRQHPGFVAVSA